jgi:hypothetical protein
MLDFRIGGTMFFFGALDGLLKLAELSTDTDEVIIGRILNVTVRTISPNTFRISRRIAVGDSARFDISLLIVGIGQYLDRIRKDRKK